MSNILHPIRTNAATQLTVTVSPFHDAHAQVLADPKAKQPQDDPKREAARKTLLTFDPDRVTRYEGFSQEVTATVTFYPKEDRTMAARTGASYPRHYAITRLSLTRSALYKALEHSLHNMSQQMTDEDFAAALAFVDACELWFADELN